MPCSEAQVLELMAFIYKQVVDTQLLKVCHIILPLLQGVKQLCQLSVQICLALLQAFQHLVRYIPALFTAHGIQGILYPLQLFVNNLLLHIQRLRYPAELVVRHDDNIPVAGLHPVEEIHTISCRVVLLRRKQHLCLRVARSVRLCNSTDIGLQTYNHRLVAHAQSLHLMCCNTHYERFAAANLVVADATAIQQEHPDTVFLRLIQVLHAILFTDSLPVKVGESLVAAVIHRLHKAVEALVILLCQLIPQFLRLVVQPLRIAVSYLLNLGCHQLQGSRVFLLDILRLALGVYLCQYAAMLITLVAHHLWRRVMQGVSQQVDAVNLIARLTRHGIECPHPCVP